MDWIEDIVENTYRNYKKRKIVLWGKYSVSETIADRLKDIYGIETAFYVDKDTSKIDNKQVFSTGCLQGKSDEYYVVVPVAYYKSLKEELTGGGYKKDQDYYYFCDCIVKMTDDYYEDSHGNKIIGSYNKELKFAFSGFNSVVRIGENVNLDNSSFYIHSDVGIEIGDKCIIKNGVWNADNTHIKVGDGCTISNCVWKVNGAHIEIGNKCDIRDNKWIGESQSYVKLGDGGSYSKGEIFFFKYAQIIIGRDFSIGSGYRFVADLYSQIIIGDDVLCSYDVALWSNDAHSIFDVHTGININSTEEICRNRKIVIGNHVWIGTHAIILYNTEICDGSIIGAASLVKCKVPNNCIAAGVPAQVIRKDIAWSRNNYADRLMEDEKVYARLTEM